MSSEKKIVPPSSEPSDLKAREIIGRLWGDVWSHALTFTGSEGLNALALTSKGIGQLSRESWRLWLQTFNNEYRQNFSEAMFRGYGDTPRKAYSNASRVAMFDDATIANVSWMIANPPSTAELYSAEADDNIPLPEEYMNRVVFRHPLPGVVTIRVPIHRGVDVHRDVPVYPSERGEVTVGQTLTAVYNTYQQPLSDEEIKKISEGGGFLGEDDPLTIEVIRNLIYFEGVRRTDKPHVYALSLGS